jgi:hypothetical protein
LTPDSSKVSPEFVFWMLKGKNAELNENPNPPAMLGRIE